MVDFSALELLKSLLKAVLNTWCDGRHGPVPFFCCAAMLRVRSANCFYNSNAHYSNCFCWAPKMGSSFACSVKQPLVFVQVCRTCTVTVLVLLLIAILGNFSTANLQVKNKFPVSWELSLVSVSCHCIYYYHFYQPALEHQPGSDLLLA